MVSSCWKNMMKKTATSLVLRFLHWCTPFAIMVSPPIPWWDFPSCSSNMMKKTATSLVLRFLHWCTPFAIMVSSPIPWWDFHHVLPTWWRKPPPVRFCVFFINAHHLSLWCHILTPGGITPSCPSNMIATSCSSNMMLENRHQFGFVFSFLMTTLMHGVISYSPLWEQDYFLDAKPPPLWWKLKCFVFKIYAKEKTWPSPPLLW